VPDPNAALPLLSPTVPHANVRQKMKSRASQSVRAEAWPRVAGWVAATPERRGYGQSLDAQSLDTRGLDASGSAAVTDPLTDADAPCESARTRLIGDISRVIREPEIPESARTAGLELIGWLARRMPGESAHSVGVQEAQESQRGMRAARRKSR
jgi:hypothetical protein